MQGQSSALAVVLRMPQKPGGLSGPGDSPHIQAPRLLSSITSLPPGMAMLVIPAAPQTALLFCSCMNQKARTWFKSPKSQDMNIPGSTVLCTGLGPPAQ